MSKHLKDVVLVVACACVLGLAGVLANQLYASSRVQAAGQSFSVITRETTSTKADKAALGAEFISIFDVLDTSGKIIGKMINTCAITGIDQNDPEKIDTKCDAILKLSDGTIELGGLLSNDATPGSQNTMAVLGGTGKYSAASGQAALKSTGSNKSEMIVKLAGQ